MERATRILLCAAALLIVALFLVIPLASLLVQALGSGIGPALDAFADPETLSAIRLTLIVAAISVPVNTLGGLLTAYALTKFRFPGRALLLMLVELPLTISPVVCGLVWVLLFGARGWFGPFLDAHGVRIVFALPGIVLATIFVTFPYVARTVMPLLEAQGHDQEEAATTLGAGSMQSFRRVTLPGVRWALLSGVLLCTARAMGEFGAVAVVSGHIRGETETVPLHIETLYNDYETTAAFSVAALLALFSLATVGLRGVLESAVRRSRTTA